MLSSTEVCTLKRPSQHMRIASSASSEMHRKHVTPQVDAAGGHDLIMTALWHARAHPRTHVSPLHSTPPSLPPSLLPFRSPCVSTWVALPSTVGPHLVCQHHLVLIGQQHITQALPVKHVTRLPRVSWLDEHVVKHLQGWGF